MRTKLLILALTLALFLTATGVVAARVAVANNGVARPRWVLSSGASDAAAGDVTIRATLGQPVVGVVTGNSGTISLGQGFWHGATSGYKIYLPLVIRNYQS
jgi:hypothetical protein